MLCFVRPVFCNLKTLMNPTGCVRESEHYYPSIKTKMKKATRGSGLTLLSRGASARLFCFVMVPNWLRRPWLSRGLVCAAETLAEPPPPTISTDEKEPPTPEYNISMGVLRKFGIWQQNGSS